MAAPPASLAMQTAPHDALRLGLPSLKEDVAPRHPVDEVQTTGAATAEATRLKMLADVYGGGLAARATIEKQILLRPARLPGAGPPSSNLGYEALTGALDEFGPADYLGPAGFAGSGAGCVGSGEAEVGGPGPHALAEAALGLGTAPVRRAGV